MKATTADAALADTLADFRKAADALQKAADDLRYEADWLERNHPLSEWSEETGASYLASSRAAREREIRVDATAALKCFDAPADLLRAIAFGQRS